MEKTKTSLSARLAAAVPLTNAVPPPTSAGDGGAINLVLKAQLRGSRTTKMLAVVCNIAKVAKVRSCHSASCKLLARRFLHQRSLLMLLRHRAMATAKSMGGGVGVNGARKMERNDLDPH